MKKYPHLLTPGKQGGNLFGQRRDPHPCFGQRLSNQHYTFYRYGPAASRVLRIVLNTGTVIAMVLGSIALIVGLMAW